MWQLEFLQLVYAALYTTCLIRMVDASITRAAMCTLPCCSTGQLKVAPLGFTNCFVHCLRLNPKPGEGRCQIALVKGLVGTAMHLPLQSTHHAHSRLSAVSSTGVAATPLPDCPCCRYAIGQRALPVLLTLQCSCMAVGNTNSTKTHTIANCQCMFLCHAIAGATCKMCQVAQAS